MANTTGPTRYYKRRRALPILKEDGTLTAPVEAMTTRFYSKELRGRGSHMHTKWYNVYYYSGAFYSITKFPTSVDADGTYCDWVHAFARIDNGVFTDRFLSQTLEQGKAAPVELHIEDGAIKAVGCAGPWDGAELLDGTEDADYIEDLLDLKPTERKRPAKAA